MYTITKKLELSAAHWLNLDYSSKCSDLHGHNWQVTITCESETLNDNGMVIDFLEIKRRVEKLDHTCLNEHMHQPTAENIAKFIYDLVPFCTRVEVIESEGNICVYS